jgi:hypothetical protein
MTDAVARALELIAKCNDPKQLRQIASNAHIRGEEQVRRAAMLRLYEVQPSEKKGTLEYDVWQSIYALEGELSHERGKTTRLSRTRQKIARDGERGTVADLVLGKVSEGFRMLVERDMPELTFEAVALRHANRFDEPVLASANQRLRDSGYDPENLRARPIDFIE